MLMPKKTKYRKKMKGNRKGHETRTTMQTDVKHQPNDAPITTDAIGTGNVQKKYYTADEAIAFLEPRIRAMFQ